MAGGKGNIRPEDGKQFSKDYQPAEKWTEKKALELGNELIQWLKGKDKEGNDKGNIFFKEFLIIENDYDDDLINYLKGKFTSFSVLIKRATSIQELKLQKYGVGDRLNATMTKFVLINKHEWKDKQEVVSTNTNIEVDYTELSSTDLQKLIEIEEKLKPKD